METLPRTSFSRRALIWRLVTNLPSRPASGEVLTPKVMRRVGASTSRRGSGRGSPGSVSVSPMVTSGRPATLTMSPAVACSMSMRSMPLAVCRLVTVPLRLTVRPGSTEPGRVVRLLADDGDALAELDGAVPDAPDGHPPDVLVGRQVGDQQLQRVIGRVGRRRGHIDQQVEQRVEVLARLVQAHRRRARLGVGVHDRELDLVLVGAEVHEQLVDIVQDLRRAGVGTVDLVEGDDDRQAPGHRLLQDVARLGQRSLGGIDQEQHAVDHEQAALHLAAEVGVAGRVHDVEADVGVVDGRLLGQDRDALLALEVARVHDPVDDGLIRPEGAGLAEHRVHERRLAVVDMGDDGDVAQVAAGAGGGAGRGVGHGGAGLRRRSVGGLSSHGTGPGGDATAGSRPPRLPRRHARAYTPGHGAVAVRRLQQPERRHLRDVRPRAARPGGPTPPGRPAPRSSCCTWVTPSSMRRPGTAPTHGSSRPSAIGPSPRAGASSDLTPAGPCSSATSRRPTGSARSS